MAATNGPWDIQQTSTNLKLGIEPEEMGSLPGSIPFVDGFSIRYRTKMVSAVEKMTYDEETNLR